DEKKVVIAVYDEKSNVSARRIAPLLGNPSKHIIYKGYKEDDIDAIIEEGIKVAKDQMDTKFILIISPEIDRYLQWASEERRMHKAQVVRTAIEETMANDAEYQQFLEDLDKAA